MHNYFCCCAQQIIFYYYIYALINTTYQRLISVKVNNAKNNKRIVKYYSVIS